jgi:adenylosuccinate lyase
MIREKAYRIVQESSNKAWNEGIELKELISINKDVTSILNNQEIQKVFDINYFLKNIDYKFKQSKLIKE